MDWAWRRFITHYLKQRYQEEITPALLKAFDIQNVMEVPHVEKVVVNIGVGEALDNAKTLDVAVADLTKITGQKPIVTKARKSIANFKLREGRAIGVKVTLRGDRMWAFLDRLINVALPRVRDFRGISLEIRRALNEGDYDGALARTEQLVRQDPGDVGVLEGSYYLLGNKRRWEQIVEWNRRAMALSPFGPTEGMRLSEVFGLLALGRLDEARTSQRQLGGSTKTFALLCIELHAERYAVAESIARVHVDDPGFESWDPTSPRDLLSMAQAGRGAVKAAAATREQRVAIYSARPDMSGDRRLAYLNNDLRNLIALSIMTGGAIPLPPDTWVRDSSTVSILTRGLLAAFTGDRRLAERL